MKINVYGNKLLFSSASFIEAPAGATYIVNAGDRTCHFHRSGGSYMADYEDIKFGHQTFLIMSEDGSSECEVVFCAENEDEGRLIRTGHCYEQLCKEQLVTVSIKDDLLEQIPSTSSASIAYADLGC